MGAPDHQTDRIIDAASSGAGAGEDDRRLNKRKAYEALVAVVLAQPDGGRSAPIVLRAIDVSIGGMAVVGRQMIHPGTRGAVQLVRSNGQRALVGFEVRHSRYAGSLRHETGLEFTALPEGLSADDFVDENGRIITLDPLLEQNTQERDEGT